MRMQRIATLFLILVLLAGCGKAKKEEKKNTFIKTLDNGHYQLMVENEPYIVKGVVYSPMPIGKSPLFNFMCDPEKPWVSDGKLMKDMGVNTIRIYQSGDELTFCKGMIEELYAMYGIRTIFGFTLGFWHYPPPNYADEEFKEEVMNNVIECVKYFKDSPGLLIWNLGNENNYSFDGRINPWSSPEIDAMQSFAEQRNARAKLYYSFVNEVAKKIKEIDPDHMVSLGNGETVGLKIAAEHCPDVDLIGAIVYRGKVFGSFFKEIKRKFDKPVVLTEFGCDAYNMYTQAEDQRNQAKFLKSQWLDMEKHFAGGEGLGNSIGGCVFEWNDEWWKTSESNRDSWLVHDTTAGWGMGAYDFDAKAGKNMNEEWFGLVALSEELVDGINKRKPRKAFYILRNLWNPVYRNRKLEKKDARKKIRKKRVINHK